MKSEMLPTSKLSGWWAVAGQDKIQHAFRSRQTDPWPVFTSFCEVRQENQNELTPYVWVEVCPSCWRSSIWDDMRGGNPDMGDVEFRAALSGKGG